MNSRRFNTISVPSVNGVPTVTTNAFKSILISLALGAFFVTAEPARAQLADGEYTLQQKSNDRYVDAYEDAGNDYRLVSRPAQIDAAGEPHPTQLWILKKVGDAYTIQQKSNNRYVDAHENSSNDYRLVSRPAQNNDSQRWFLKQVGDAYSIQQKSNARYLDAYEDAGNDYRLVSRPAQNNDTQRWKLKQVNFASSVTTPAEATSGALMSLIAYGAEDVYLTPEVLTGNYRRSPVQNAWHTGKIVLQGDKFVWSNDAGVSWDLAPDFQNNRLTTGADNPYYDYGQPANREFQLIVKNEQVVGFEFNGEPYMRELYLGDLSDICSEGLANVHAGMVPPSYLPAPDTVERTEIIELPVVGGGSRFEVRITRNGDLLNEIFVENEADIVSVELEIGGIRIDRIYSETFPILRELYGMRGLPFQLLKGGLPLIALQYHEVRLLFEMRSPERPILHVNYIFLNSEERRRFAQIGHERMIYQSQHTGVVDGATDHITMDFKGPIVALLVKTIPYSKVSYLEVDGRAFQLGEKEHENGYDIFRFAPSLYSEESHYPINLSGCDYAALNFVDSRSKTVYVYAVGSNVLRMMSGMGGLAYSN